MDNPIYASAHGLAWAIRAKQLSSVEVVEAHPAQIARHDPPLHAVVTLAEAAALERARAADAALARGDVWGPLNGVPMTPKDVHETTCLRTTAGFPPLSDYVPVEDGAAAARMKGAVGIVLGKTNVPVMAGDV
jgi:amidase